MAQNRTMPYGYKVENGKVVINNEESKIVEMIYSQYLEGFSYKRIAEMLTLKDVRYQSDKPTWNKNMIARILQNPKYRGIDRYPQIIKCEVVKSKKVSSSIPRELKEIKPILRCAKCGGTIKRRIDKNNRQRWYCTQDITHIDLELNDKSLLEELNEFQAKLSNYNLQDTQDNITSFELGKLQNEINNMLESAMESISDIQSKLLELTSLKYSLCKDTLHIEKEILQELKNSPNELNPKLLVEIISSIAIDRNSVYAIELKSGLIIMRGEL